MGLVHQTALDGLRLHVDVDALTPTPIGICPKEYLISILTSLASLTTAVMGCGSSDAKPNLDGGNASPWQPSCTIALTGGVASNHSCSVTLAYDGAAKATDFSLSATNVDSDVEPSLFVSIQIAGSARTLVKSLGGDVLSDSEVWHVYTFANGLIERMDLKESETSSDSTASTAFSRH